MQHPILKLSKRMAIRLLQNVTFYLNDFPNADDVSELSPLITAQGKIVDFALHYQVEFGAYVQTLDLTENNMHTYATRAIAMVPSLNYKGDMISYSLYTGKALDQSINDFTIAPIIEDAIQQRMTFMAKDSPAGSIVWDQLEKPYGDEEDNDSIMIHITDIHPVLPHMNPDTHTTF